MEQGVKQSRGQRAGFWLSLAGLAVCAAAGVYFWQAGLLGSQQALHAWVAGFGPAGAAVFVAFQAVQVVVPILPGGLGCLAGVVLFGPWQGFLYNYLGICAGSLAAFGIARACGRPLLYKLFPGELIARYDRWGEQQDRFARWFAFLIFIPVAPDDYLCFLAGTTRLPWRAYTAIILLCKPFSIALYSLGLTVVAQQLLGLWR